MRGVVCCVFLVSCALAVTDVPVESVYADGEHIFSLPPEPGSTVITMEQMQNNVNNPVTYTPLHAVAPVTVDLDKRMNDPNGFATAKPPPPHTKIPPRYLATQEPEEDPNVVHSMPEPPSGQKVYTGGAMPSSPTELRAAYEAEIRRVQAEVAQLTQNIREGAKHT